MIFKPKRSVIRFDLRQLKVMQLSEQMKEVKASTEAPIIYSVDLH